MKNVGVIISFFAASIVSASTAINESPSVKIGCTTYQGVQKEDAGVNAYYGIRYASPPTEDLRWRAPVPLDPRNAPVGFVNATTRGPACLQNSPPWQPASSYIMIESEDCLLMDIVTPINVKGKLPVLVNIHGGGYVSGVATQGDSIVYHSNGSIIYVAIQYRLGPLGFLAGEEVASDGTPNAGLLDQRAALEWVRQYIHHFGGDPDKVTITGGSAGGGSVVMQMILDGGEQNPPFRAVISEYPWMTPMYPTDWYNKQYEGLLSASDCDDIACLRSLPVDSLKSATKSAAEIAYNNGDFGYGTFYWGPSVDGKRIRDYPLNEFRNSHFTKVPFVVDREGYEGYVFTNPSTKAEEDVATSLEMIWQTKNKTFINQVLELYPTDQFNATLLDDFRGLRVLSGNTTIKNSFAKLENIVSDVLIDCQTSAIAKYISNNGLAAYKMTFNAGSQLHGATMEFLFSSSPNPTGAAGAGGIPIAYPNATLASYMRDYFVSFVLYMDPNQYAYGQKPPSWPRFTKEDPKVLRVEFESIGASLDPEDSPQCRFLTAAPRDVFGV
ncbi:carboxylesterase family protein [Colletotrichum truncatum]|uniref:Carboxylesterase family protein n=1 Tax=Colletotrichum truncatum TaxID=5467 RepID=A0ACC3YC29_COLTU|nr:carboxylesterase family protein [Colletotrichum truncatum]KAF6781617.1 carboxylesterase family protein [Colletotrichum truncatum]